MNHKSKLARVVKAWKDLPEKYKKHFCQRIYIIDSKLFKNWSAKVANKGSFRSKIIAERKHKNLNEKLDEIFFEIGKGTFAEECIMLYFTKCNTKINKFFLENKKEGESCDVAEKVIEQLYVVFQDKQPLVIFYEAALRWIYPDMSVPGDKLKKEIPNITKQKDKEDNQHSDSENQEDFKNQQQKNKTKENNKNSSKQLPRKQLDNSKNNIELDLPCGQSTIVPLEKATKKLKLIQEKFESWKKQLDQRIYLLDPNESTVILAKDIKEIREDILEATEKIIKIVNNIKKQLPLCKCPESIKCNINDFVINTSWGKVETTQQLLDYTISLLTEMSITQNKITDIVKDNTKLQQNIETIEKELGNKQRNIKSKHHATTLLKATETSNQLKIKLARIEKEEVNKIREVKDNISIILDSLKEEFNISSAPASLKKEMTKIKSQIDFANTLHKIQIVKNATIALEEQFDKHPELYNSKFAASRVIKNNFACKDIISLAHLLVKQEQSDTALFILCLMQETREYIESDLEDADEFVNILLQSMANITKKNIFGNKWPVMLINGKWIQAINTIDINENNKVRIAIAILLAINSAYYNTIHETAVRLHLHEALCHLKLEKLSMYFEQAVIRNHQVKITTDDKKLMLNKSINTINDLFDKNGAGYKHQKCRSTKIFAKFEINNIFPQLQQLWIKVHNFCEEGNYMQADKFLATKNAKDLYHDMAAKEKLHKHTAYTKRILTFINEVLDKLNNYVSIASQTNKTKNNNFYINDLIKDIEKICKEDNTFEEYWHFIHEKLALLEVSKSEEDVSKQNLVDPIISLINNSANVINLVPEIIIEYCSNDKITFKKDFLEKIIKRIAGVKEGEDAITMLKKAKCWQHILLLTEIYNITKEDSKNLKDEKSKIINQLNEFKNRGIQEETILQLQNYVEVGRFILANKEIATNEENLRTEGERHQHDFKKWCKKKHNQLNHLKDMIWKAPMSDSWKNEMQSYASLTETKLRNIKSAKKSDTKNEIQKIFDVLEFTIYNQHFNLKELQGLLGSFQANVKEPHPSITEDSLFDDLPKEYNKIIENCKMLCQRNIDKPERIESQCWEYISLGLARACNLYCDLGKTFKFMSLEDQGISMARYNTRFKKPKFEYLTTEVYFYLLPGIKANKDEINSLRNIITSQTGLIARHIIVVPGNELKILDAFGRGNLAHATVLYSKDIIKILHENQPAISLRQMLLNSQELTNASPFKIAGYVDNDNNIFVGRVDYIKKIQQGGNYAIYGGRRIGKTSLMHASKKALCEKGWTVGYVSADCLAGTSTCPDKYLCLKIAKKLGWENINNLDEFINRLESELKEKRIVILIDEVDTYIRKSRDYSQNPFSLFYNLRSLTQLPEIQFHVVVSGFKELFYEIHLKQNVPSDYPFKNFFSDCIPLRQLTVTEAEELIEEGFPALGIKININTTRSLCQHATTHPNFLQFFCNNLVKLIAHRKEPNKQINIRVEDIKNVYNSTGDTQPFVEFFDETLTMNLSELGRAIMLIIAVLLIGPDGNSYQLFTKKEICKELADYFALAEVSEPNPNDLKRTFSFLEMTGMLGIEDNKFRLVFPRYVDILVQLEENNQDRIINHIKQYNKNEREKIV